MSRWGGSAVFRFSSLGAGQVPSGESNCHVFRASGRLAVRLEDEKLDWAAEGRMKRRVLKASGPTGFDRQRRAVAAKEFERYPFEWIGKSFGLPEKSFVFVLKCFGYCVILL